MLSDPAFRQLLSEHLTDDRAERALRDERAEWMEREMLAVVKVDERVWELEVN